MSRFFLEFLLRATDASTAAEEEAAPAKLFEPSAAVCSASFTRTIAPKDLDLLSRAIGCANGQDARALAPFLRTVFKEDCEGVFGVDPSWVAYVAATPTDAAAFAACEWVCQMQRAHDDPDLCVDDETVSCVRNLLSLCRNALEAGGRVYLYAYHPPGL